MRKSEDSRIAVAVYILLIAVVIIAGVVLRVLENY